MAYKYTICLLDLYNAPSTTVKYSWLCEKFLDGKISSSSNLRFQVAINKGRTGKHYTEHTMSEQLCHELWDALKVHVHDGQIDNVLAHLAIGRVLHVGPALEAHLSKRFSPEDIHAADATPNLCRSDEAKYIEAVLAPFYKQYIVVTSQPILHFYRSSREKRGQLLDCRAKGNRFIWLYERSGVSNIVIDANVTDKLKEETSSPSSPKKSSGRGRPLKRKEAVFCDPLPPSPNKFSELNDQRSTKSPIRWNATDIARSTRPVLKKPSFYEKKPTEEKDWKRYEKSKRNRR